MANNVCMTLILLHLLAESLLYLDILCDHEKSSEIMHCIAIPHDQGSYILDAFNSYALHASYIQHVNSAINTLITLRILVKIPFSHFSDQRLANKYNRKLKLRWKS